MARSTLAQRRAGDVLRLCHELPLLSSSGCGPAAAINHPSRPGSSHWRPVLHSDRFAFSHMFLCSGC